MKDPRPEDQDPALRELRQDEDAAQQGVRERLAGLEQRLVQEAEKFPEEFQQRFQDIQRRLHDAKDDFDSSVEDFRRQFLAAPVSEDEVRARLVMLDMEYGSRTRLAEEGLRLLAESLDAHLETSRSWIRRFCEEAHGAAKQEVYPAREKVVEALRRRSRWLRAQEDAVRERLRSLERAEKRVLELEREKCDLLAKQDWQAAKGVEAELEKARAVRGAESAKADLEGSALRAKIRELEAEVQKLQAGARELEESNRRMAEVSDSMRAEADELRRQLTEREESASLMREAFERNQSDLRSARSEVESLQGRLEVESARLEEYAKGAQELIDGLHKEIEEKGARIERLQGELEALKKYGGAQELQRRLNVSESELAQARKEVQELERAAAELQECSPGSKAEAAELQRRLNAAESELSQARKEIQELERAAAELQKCAPGSREEAAAFEAEHQRRLASKEAELDQAKRDIRELERACAELQECAPDSRGEAQPPEKASPELQKRYETTVAELEGMRSEVQRLSTELKTSQQKNKDILRRLMAADKERDQGINEERDRWALEKEELEERLAARTRELNQLKLESEASERAWIETVARQDAERVQELFKLRSKIQQFKWALEQRKPSPPKDEKA